MCFNFFFWFFNLRPFLIIYQNIFSILILIRPNLSCWGFGTFFLALPLTTQALQTEKYDREVDGAQVSIKGRVRCLSGDESALMSRLRSPKHRALSFHLYCSHLIIKLSELTETYAYCYPRPWPRPLLEYLPKSRTASRRTPHGAAELTEVTKFRNVSSHTGTAWDDLGWARMAARAK